MAIPVLGFGLACTVYAVLSPWSGQDSSTGAGHGWRTDPAWHDGQAEKCVYEAVRAVYGVPRRYLAIVYTNKEHVDPLTTAKSDTGAGLEVFKHHWSERVPTENYDYDFSTSSYTLADSMEAYKLTAATQDDCGASFKEAVRRGERLEWWDSVYFPGGGARRGEIADAAGVHFEDALALVLRNHPFDGATRTVDGAPRTLEIVLVRSQKDPRQAPWVPEPVVVEYSGREQIELPDGHLESHRLVLRRPSGEELARYWFAADGKAPWLHVLLRSERPDGTSYRLKSHERTAYWKR